MLKGFQYLTIQFIQADLSASGNLNGFTDRPAAISFRLTEVPQTTMYSLRKPQCKAKGWWM